MTYITISLFFAAASLVFLWSWSLLATGGKPFGKFDDVVFLSGISLGILLLSFLWPIAIIATGVLIFLAAKGQHAES